MVRGLKALKNKRKSNSKKTPTKNGVTGANLKVARETKAAKRIRLQKEEELEERNLIRKKRKQKERAARKQEKKYGHRGGRKKKPLWK